MWNKPKSGMFRIDRLETKPTHTCVIKQKPAHQQNNKEKGMYTLVKLFLVTT